LFCADPHLREFIDLNGIDAVYESPIHEERDGATSNETRIDVERVKQDCKKIAEMEADLHKILKTDEVKNSTLKKDVLDPYDDLINAAVKLRPAVATWGRAFMSLAALVQNDEQTDQRAAAELVTQGVRLLNYIELIQTRLRALNRANAAPVLARDASDLRQKLALLPADEKSLGAALKHELDKLKIGQDENTKTEVSLFIICRPFLIDCLRTLRCHSLLRVRTQSCPKSKMMMKTPSSTCEIPGIYHRNVSSSPK
jgi:hypothetical protein